MVMGRAQLAKMLSSSHMRYMHSWRGPLTNVGQVSAGRDIRACRSSEGSEKERDQQGDTGLRVREAPAAGWAEQEACLCAQSLTRIPHAPSHLSPSEPQSSHL